MSLRLRMLLVVVLALVALLVAGLALAAIVRESRAATIATLAADTEAAAVALARASRGAPLSGPVQAPEVRAAIREHATSVLEPLTETRGGYCFRDGDFIEAESGSFRRGAGAGPPGPPPEGPAPHGGGPPDAPAPHSSPPPPRRPRGGEVGPPGPPPHVRAALGLACQRAEVDRVDRQDIDDHGDTVMVFVVGADERSAAFAIRIVPGSRGERGALWWSVLVGLPIVTLVIVAVMIETIFALRRGVRDLEGTMTHLEHDLRGDVARPRAEELAQIADHLRRTAMRLADARDRERSLERQVAHQARLGSLGRLVAGVAHEIRNPLTGIKLLLDGMRRRELDRRTERDVATCLQEIARLNDIVTAFLGIARDAQAEPARFDAGALADERIAAASGISEAHGVRVVRRGSGAAFAERNAVVQIVDNLLRNAVEASPAGAEVVVVVEENGLNTNIAVIDRGEGVPGSLVENLFEPFITSKPGGTGLGLWLSYTAATSRGGDLRYDRASGETRFTLTLPARPS